MIGLQLLIDQLEQVFDLLPKRRRDVRHLQRGLQITPRLGVRAKLIIEHPELISRDAELGIIEAQLLVSKLAGRASTPANTGSMVLRKSEPLWAANEPVKATISAAAPATSAIKRKGARCVQVVT